MDKFPEYFESKKRAMPGSPEGFNDLSEPVDAPLTKEEIKASSTVDTKLVKHLQSIGGSLLWLVIRTRPDLAYILYTGPMAMRYTGLKSRKTPLD
eukprot:763286-Amphidinium_carterae.1